MLTSELSALQFAEKLFLSGEAAHRGCRRERKQAAHRSGEPLRHPKSKRKIELFRKLYRKYSGHAREAGKTRCRVSVLSSELFRSLFRSPGKYIIGATSAPTCSW